MSRPLTEEHVNLELGAGCESFGQLYYPKCYVTEYNQSLSCDMEHIDHFCSAHDTGLDPDRFLHIIMSNPFAYGFNELEPSRQLITELLRVLKKQGKIVILASKNNKYAAP